MARMPRPKRDRKAPPTFDAQPAPAVVAAAARAAAAAAPKARRVSFDLGTLEKEKEKASDFELHPRVRSLDD